MTAITTQACEAAMSKARTQDKPKEATAIKRQSFFCKRRGRKVAPAQCADCWDAKPYTEKFSYHESRQNCIKENKEKPVTQKPSLSSNLPEPRQPLPVGAEVEVKEKGQYPVHVQITKEMVEDHEAALTYAAQAAKDKMRGEILLCVAVALYAGDSGKTTEEQLASLKSPLAQIRDLKANRHRGAGLSSKLVGYCPWVIDGYPSFQEAIKEVFGMGYRSAKYRRAIGKALIAQFGKENVIAKAEAMGIARIPQRKLRELLKAPKFFEDLCTRGRVRLPDGEEITLDRVLDTGIDELPALLAQFAGTPRALPSTEKKKKDPFKAWKEDDPFKDTPLAAKEAKILSTVGAWVIALREIRDGVAQDAKLWPQDAPEIMGSSPDIQKAFEDFDGILLALLRTSLVIRRNPEQAEEVANCEEGSLDGLRTIARDLLDLDDEEKAKRA